MWDVYVSGNFNIIVAAYNALAMIFSDGHNIYYGAGILALLMLLITSLMKLTDDNQKPVHNFFFGLIIFTILGGPATKVTVLIESRITQQVQTIDNVPLLVAVSGSIATTLLSRITDDFRTAFQVIQPINNAGNTVFGGLDPLRTLVKLNQADYANAMICRVASGNTDLCDTMTNYIRDCVARDILTGGSAQETSIGKMMNTAPQESLLGIKSTNNYWSTQTAVKSGTPVVKTCAAMYTYIDSLVTSASFKTQVDRYNEFVGITPDSLESAGQIVMQAGMSAYDMAVQRMVWESSRRGLSQAGDMIGAQTNMMQFTAKDQRLIKMASSYEMFNELAPALITFFEFFAIFIAPTMLILLATGRFGFMAAGSYIMFILFTNLWPLMAVGVESYINFAMASDMSSAQGYGAAALSWNGTPGVIEKAQTYLAVGSMMMAAIPTLAMAVLFKGVHSMSGVASKASPDAPINPQYVSPNIAAAPNGGKVSMGQQNAAWAPGSVGPGVMSGPAAYTKSLNTGQALTEQLTESVAGAKQALAQTQVAVQKSASKLTSFADNAGSNQNLSETEKAALSSDYQAYSAVMKQYQADTGRTSQQAVEDMKSNSDQWKSWIGGEAGVKTPSFSPIVVKATMGSQGSMMFGSGNSEKTTYGKTDGRGDGKTNSAGLGNGLASKIEQAKAFLNGDTLSNNAEYKQAATDLQQSVNAFSEQRQVVEQQQFALSAAKSGMLNASTDLGLLGQRGEFNAGAILNILSKDSESAQSFEKSGILKHDGSLSDDSQRRLMTIMDTVRANSDGSMSESAIASVASLTFLTEKGLQLFGGLDADDRKTAAKLFSSMNEVRPDAALQQLSELGFNADKISDKVEQFGNVSDVSSKINHVSNAVDNATDNVNTKAESTYTEISGNVNSGKGDTKEFANENDSKVTTEGLKNTATAYVNARDNGTIAPYKAEALNPKMENANRIINSTGRYVSQEKLVEGYDSQRVKDLPATEEEIKEKEETNKKLQRVTTRR